MASTELTRTMSTGTSRRTFTISTWFKRSKTSSGYPRICAYDQDDSNRFENYIHQSDHMYVEHVSGGSQNINLITSRVFRDLNAWYHMVVSIDTTQATASDRVKLYINGVQETSFSTATYPSQNADLIVGTANVFLIGETGYQSGGQNFDGLMSHFHHIDGTAYDASAFGSTDSTTGEWKIKTSPSVTYGTNGFFILKDGNSVTDQSGNSNNFTVAGGTLTKTEDNPSNVFATLNPLARYGGNLNITNGNTTADETANNWQIASCTLGASTGKWYYEYKITTLGTGGGYHKLGFISDQAFSNAAVHIAQSALDGGYAFYCQNGNLEVRNDDAVVSGYDIATLGVSFSNNDIMCLAVDMDNKRAYFRKNGDAWIKSADPVNGTNGLDISADYTAGKAMIPAISIYYGGAGSINLGNGYFGQSAVSSAGTNASNNGIFEYDVPTGYTALSTKGLNL